jgi:short-subunit dehydrogenase
MDLNRKVSILTGASRGLGVSIAEGLARKGADLVLAARSAEDLDKTAERIRGLGARALTVPTDVTKKSDLKNLVKKTEAEFGRVDVLINNAGVESIAVFHQQEAAEIESIIRTNVISLELLTRLVVPQMVARRSGHVVNIASLAGKTAVPYNTVYSSSKHAVIGFSLSLREELADHGVGVSVICPSFVSDAGMFADWSVGEDPPKLAPTVTPEAVSDAVVKSIEKNRSEIVVAKGLSKVADVAHAISPTLTARTQKAFGVTDFLKDRADRKTSE